jgi:hypothetical protein
MMVIAESLFASRQRPKWTPRNWWAQSVVLDNGVRVYGPATRNHCQWYIDRKNKENVND